MMISNVAGLIVYSTARPLCLRPARHVNTFQPAGGIRLTTKVHHDSSSHFRGARVKLEL